MSNMQIIIAVFLAAAFPTAAALVGMLLGRRESHDLRIEFRSDLRDIRAEITLIRERLTTLEAR